MTPDYDSRVRALSPEKALALAAYGESVAAYRYRTLCERTPSKPHRKLFTEMADEEQSHHLRLQDLLKANFPGSDFVLSAGDKELVTVGPRMIEVTDRPSFERAMKLIRESEILTGRFYACLHDAIDLPDMKPFLKEMAEECFEHAARLDRIPPLPDKDRSA